jgi:hypothetical protein
VLKKGENVSGLLIPIMVQIPIHKSLNSLLEGDLRPETEILD